MSQQVSPFMALTNAEKQIKWLEYQSIRLPYVSVPTVVAESEKSENSPKAAEPETQPVREAVTAKTPERPVPPPEIPRMMPSDFHKTRHSQYDAVIARMKQADLQAQRYAASHATQQG